MDTAQICPEDPRSIATDEKWRNAVGLEKNSAEGSQTALTHPSEESRSISTGTPLAGSANEVLSSKVPILGSELVSNRHENSCKSLDATPQLLRPVLTVKTPVFKPVLFEL
jgi:hypothetical protein